MPPVPFPTDSTPAPFAQESGGRLVNGYVSEVKGAPASPVKWNRSAGLFETLTIDVTDGYETTDINCRGLQLIGGTLMHIVNEATYAVIQDTNIRLSATRLGALPGTHQATFAQNNVQPVPDTWAVADNAAWLLFTDSAPTSYDGGGNLVSPNSVTSLNGRAIFSSPGGKLQATEFNSTTLNSNSFVDLPEGNLQRVVTFKNELYAFGDEFFRVYRDEGATPFPLVYTQIKGDIGLADTHAIAGFEPGWSGSLIFAGSDSRVYQMEGYTPVPISTDPVATAIAGATQSDLVARAYVSNGTAFWTITAPGLFTWEYNLDTGSWNERESYQRADWRGRATIKAFGRWIAGEDATGNLYSIIAGWPSEGTAPLIWTLESGIVSDSQHSINIPWMYPRFTAGVGLDAGLIPTQTQPKLRVFTSRDGGGKFGNPIELPLGNEGETNIELKIGNSGLSNRKGIQRRFEISDGVHVGFMGATAEVEVLES